MTPDDILEHVRRQPFIPFRLHTNNGRWVDVKHPEMIATGEAASVVAVVDGPRLRTLSLVTITELELLPPAVA